MVSGVLIIIMHLLLLLLLLIWIHKSSGMRLRRLTGLIWAHEAGDVGLG